ncbi:MAG: alanine:cation symporter family protein [Sandaracinaceae bacterium]|nr:alanine:cation symporter family protein [Myxococcales bacterium]MCB9658989.1 alanine:cation symporter family protein [Sandaracinaceae bacterium]
MARRIEAVDAQFGRWVVVPIASVLMKDVWFWDDGGDPTDNTKVPFIVAWLILGAVFFTFRFRFINVRAFTHALRVVRGDFDDPSHAGEVSHFQALSSALSATVGLGNIAGVAVAVKLGGPGALFWMVVAAFFGMTSKFAECTLGQMYRSVDETGRVLGGPMQYLKRGFAELGMTRLGKVMATLFAVLCIGGSFGGGNMFQSNQSYQGVIQIIPALDNAAGKLIYGVLLAALVGVVIIGGIKRIGQVASAIVPLMCGLYLIAGLIVLVTNVSAIPAAFALIFERAFAPQAVSGGVVGVLAVGFQRAAFSNEAGVGSAAIAHSAAATDEPIREGIVASIGPFIDTVVVCLMTGLVLIVTGAWTADAEGVALTSIAFQRVVPWFPDVLSVAVFLFAYSTLISWSYYGERCWAYLVGEGKSLWYKLMYLGAVVLGSVLKLGSVIDFSDMMILGMALPNIVGVIILSPKIGTALDTYWAKLKSGQMTVNRGTPQTF